MKLELSNAGGLYRFANVTLRGVQVGKVLAPIYGVTTGFGSNADKLLGAHRARDELPGGNPEAPEGTLL